MRKLFFFLDDNLIGIIAGFLLVFLPLYPKLPLFEAIPGYLVRVRLEDLLVSLTILLWIVWVIRGKVKISGNPLLKPISVYLLVGFLSVLSAIFVIKTIPLEKIHIMKISLHFLRRFEYFSLFFIFYSSIKSIRQIKVYLILLALTVMGVSIYGFGQKYLYWPAFSTMNREFAKGWMLYLTAHARVLSTFAGHYDLAAFIMMILVLFWSLFLGIKKWIFKIPIFIVIAFAFWTLILTASRTSFIAYILGLTVMFLFWMYRKGIKWVVPRYLAVVFLSMIVMLSFGDMSERFTKFLRINERIGGIKLLLLSPIGRPPSERAIFLANNPREALSLITSKTDQPPKIGRPTDVYEDVPLHIPTDQGLQEVKRTYSQTAYMFDLSTAIRFDALWPQAIKGFQRNVLLGSGYSTLNKTQLTDFTEAESTDNDYLRSLGETGILGFMSFFGTLFFIIYLIWRNLVAVRDPILFSITVGLAGLLVGLLVNAAYIDVFEASKVAFSFWGLSGIILAGINIAKNDRRASVPLPMIPDLAAFKTNLLSRTRKIISSDYFLLLLILISAIALRLYKINTPLADWHSWRQADTSAVTRNYVKHGINILYPTFDDLSNVASGMDNPRGLRFVEFPLYNLASVVVDKLFIGFNVEISGRLTSIFASLGSIIFLFLIVRKYLGRKIAFFSSLFFAIIPYNIYYSRVILPEPFLVFSSLGMIYFFDKFVEKISRPKADQPLAENITFKIKIFLYLLLSIIFTAFSLLIKPFAAFLFLPLTYLWFRNIGISFKSIIGMLVYCLVCLLPFVWWRFWMSHFPEGIPASMWLFNGDKIRFKGAFFYWIFADRLGRLILGYFGLPIFIAGILNKLKKENWFFSLWGISMLLYVAVVATGNVRHDYYQILTIPIITIFLGKGTVFFLESAGKFLPKWRTYFILFIILVFQEMFGWYHIRDLYNINHPEIVEAGSVVERKTSDKTLVIAPYNGDTAFLYQTRRAGWPIIEGDIEELIKKGAHYYVSVSFDDLTNQLINEANLPDETKRKYKIIDQTSKYVIIQLVSDKELPK
jgi:hypothetical protein